jgi:L-ascorbate metabolism protein UlaG (beta-lactamase superfamily)
MRITKYGHACILVERDEARILIDPGSFNALPEADRIDAVLVTHEHGDHCDIGQLRAILARNPDARVITHEAVGRLLEEAGVAHELIEDGGSVTVNGVSIESQGTEHAIIYGDASPCRNTGFLIGGELFVPGDALQEVPLAGVRVLALPTSGPWMKLAEAIDYAKRVRPEIAFPIHDALYTEEVQRTMIPRLVGGNLEAAGIAFRDMSVGSVEEF